MVEVPVYVPEEVPVYVPLDSAYAAVLVLVILDWSKVMRAPHDQREIIEVADGGQCEVGESSDAAIGAGAGLQYHAAGRSGQGQGHALDLLDVFQRSNSEKIERSIRTVLQRALGEIRIILTIRLYGTGVVEELHGVARLAVRVARVAEQWTILQQAFDADGGVDGHRHLEFLAVDVFVRVHADGHRGVGAARGLILANHQRAGFRGAQPVDVTHVVARLVFAQSVEVEIIIHDLAGWLAFQVAGHAGIQSIETHGTRVDEYGDAVGQLLFVTHQTERVSLADAQWADGQYCARYGTELHIGLLGLPGSQHGDVESFMRIADWQISACRGRRRSAGVVDADDNGYGVSHGHAMIGYDDGRVEACVAEGKHDCREHHHHRHDAEYEQLIPAQKRERNKACDACARYRPAQGRDVGCEEPSDASYRALEHAFSAPATA